MMMLELGHDRMLFLSQTKIREDMAEERMTAVLDYVSDVGEANAAGYFDILHFIKPIVSTRLS